MQFSFCKYQGTGNDFVIIDNRQLQFPKNDTKLIARLCHRRFGIGADGLMLLENAIEEDIDFVMVYYNSDGQQSTMCGNGGRCLVAFAKRIGIIEQAAIFTAIDGRHTAKVRENGSIELEMQNVSDIKMKESYYFLDTGSPHHVELVENLEEFAVQEEGRRIRNGEPYGREGTNVNFVEQQNPDTFAVRTYERGVEDETYSCGTGVTAVALSMHRAGKTTHNKVYTSTPGGLLEVSFRESASGYSHIFLTGPAEFVFEGTIAC